MRRGDVITVVTGSGFGGKPRSAFPVRSVQHTDNGCRKRGVIGTYHHMSEAHLARYTANFDFRFNSRKINDGERADAALVGAVGAVGKRLTYRRADAA